MKKVITTVLILCLITSILCGCNSKQTDVSPSPSQNTETKVSPDVSITMPPPDVTSRPSDPPVSHIILPSKTPTPIPTLSAIPTPTPSIVPTATPTPVPLDVAEIPIYPLERYAYAEDSLTISGETYIINIEKGIYYPLELGTYVEEIIDTLEEQSGMSFFKNTYLDEKIEINVSSTPGAYGGITGIKVDQMDMFIYSGHPQWVFTHELSHVLQMRNCSLTLQSLSEAYTTVNTLLMPQYLSSLNTFDAFYNYSKFDNEAQMMENTEEYFRDITGWDSYLSGFRLAFYLVETYGEGIFPEFFIAIQDEYNFDPADKDGTMWILKNVTSETVFDDFITWYKDNRELFVGRTSDADYSDLDRYDVYLRYEEDRKYIDIPAFKYDSVLTLDFREGYSCLQHSGFTINGIYGSVWSQGSHIVEFYDAEDQLIEEISVSPITSEFNVDGAVYIKITGDDTYLDFRFEIEKMVD